MFHALGQKTINIFEVVGGLTITLGQSLRSIFKGEFNFSNTIDQMIFLGLNSCFIIVLTAGFVGMVFTVQIIKDLTRAGGASLLGGVVGIAIWRELGPVMAAIVIAGRVGAAISAELGTMKVTEQIDALRSMATDPIDYLVAPRIIAILIMLPLLAGIADIVGFFGGYSVAVFMHKIPSASFLNSAQKWCEVSDILGGLTKAACFGVLIAGISCYFGLRAEKGAKGVGEVTTKAVVYSLMAIFISNYFLALIIFG